MSLQRSTLAVILSFLLLTSSACAAWCDRLPLSNSNWPHAPDDRVNKASIEKLIDQFTTITDDSFACFTTSPSFVFYPLEDEASEAHPPESMRNLIAIGVRAVPALLDHLTDARPTQLKLKTGFSHYWSGNEFDVRPYDRNPKPAGTRKDGQPIGGITTHTVTVGDVCYATLGQIVGRNYIVVEHMDGSYSMVNSPTSTPAIAAAAKSEWAGLTRQDHIRSLLADTYSGETPTEALKRLCYYYPAEGKAAALAMLSRPICDYDVTANFVDNSLLEMPTFEEKDIISIKTLRNALSHPSSRAEKYLARKMEGASYLRERRLRPVDVVNTISSLLNHAMVLPIYTSKPFAHVSLRPETRCMLAAKPRGFELMCANRKLLEDLFPQELTRRSSPSREPAVWSSRLESFVKKNGQAYADYVWQYLRPRTVHHAYDNGAALSERAAQILHALYPNRDVTHPIFTNAADHRDQEDLLTDLQAFHDPDLDNATVTLRKSIGNK
ncbi:MAG: hypothetical protein ABIY70_19020 [Capsulimonas sp.]|uniref:hypothetical protein n=1 Tax=Capsulimonas sp. TaxID=2494211 RepID=UPI003267848B